MNRRRTDPNYQPGQPDPLQILLEEIKQLRQELALERAGKPSRREDGLPTKPYGVIAGGYEGGNRSVKFDDSYATLEEALLVMSKGTVNYPWSFLTFNGRYLALTHEGYTPFRRRTP